MAVEDIPPRRKRGLGTRLTEIIANTPEYRPSAAEALYGSTPVVSAPTEEMPEAIEPLNLPVPEYIRRIRQSNTGFRKTSRPDRTYKYGYYGAGPTMSTRVQAMQWIPTNVVSSNEPANDAYSETYRASIGSRGSSMAMGDILVAFARPSNSQDHALYVYPDHTDVTWSTLKTSNSIGAHINRLGNGRKYTDTDGVRYKKLHANTMFYGELYDMWIFDELDEWSKIRTPNNGEGLSGRSR